MVKGSNSLMCFQRSNITHTGAKYSNNWGRVLLKAGCKNHFKSDPSLFFGVCFRDLTLFLKAEFPPFSVFPANCCGKEMLPAFVECFCMPLEELDFHSLYVKWRNVGSLKHNSVFKG